MNFFGHALVASWRSADPAFALGAMLPDFATMVGARPETAHPELSAGIAFHHATDRVFHAIPAFRTLETATVARLSAAGLTRGPARAAAHVSVELCLDNTLAQDPRDAELYFAALAHAPSVAIDWSPTDAAPRWPALYTRLLARGIPGPDPADLARRVTVALSGRPLLSLDPPAAATLALHLPAILSATAAATPTILSALRSSL